MRKLVGLTAFFAVLALLFGVGALPASADPGNGNGHANGHANGNGDNGKSGNTNSGNAGGNGNNPGGGTTQAGNPPGANGTVKIHDWPEHKNSSDMANDPKVCQFEIHGFKFDRGQTGRWWIQEHKWGNGDASKAVLSGSYGPADANGDWTSGPYKLADGHYKLFVEMTHPAGNSGKTVTTYKHKVFKVECQTSGTPRGSGSNSDNTNNSNSANNSNANTNSANSANSANSTNTNSSNSTDTTTDIKSTTTVLTTETGNVVIRVETTTFTEAGEEVRVVRIFNNDVLVLTFDSRTTPLTVAGFESAPNEMGIAADDSQAPSGSSVAGSETAPRSTVAGSESSPDAALAALASLPATSTGTAGLSFLGLAITGLGLALLRRSQT